jgi:hypothetical protein
MGARREVVSAVTERYRSAKRAEKGRESLKSHGLQPKESSDDEAAVLPLSVLQVQEKTLFDSNGGLRAQRCSMRLRIRNGLSHSAAVASANFNSREPTWREPSASRFLDVPPRFATGSPS